MRGRKLYILYLYINPRAALVLLCAREKWHHCCRFISIATDTLFIHGKSESCLLPFVPASPMNFEARHAQNVHQLWKQKIPSQFNSFAFLHHFKIFTIQYKHHQFLMNIFIIHCFRFPKCQNVKRKWRMFPIWDCFYWKRWKKKFEFRLHYVVADGIHYSSRERTS